MHELSQSVNVVGCVENMETHADVTAWAQVYAASKMVIEAHIA
jgi:hypothetical protein